MSSTALLSVLLSLGIAVVAVLWGINEGKGGGGAASAGQLEDFQRAADADISRIQADLDTARDETEALKDENRNLRLELGIEKNAIADLMKANDRLESRWQSHLAGGSKGEGGRDWADDELDLRNSTEELVVTIRERKMPSPLGYQFADWDGMRAALAAEPSFVPESRANDLSLAYAAMGFAPEGTDVRARTLDFLEGQLGGALFTGGSTMLFQNEATTKSVHDRTALATQVVRYIQDGNFQLSDKLGATIGNGDAQAAIRALSIGDAQLVKIRFQLQDSTAAAADDLLQSPTKMTREQFERIPAFIREEQLFPYALGDRFCQKLHEAGKWSRLDEALQNPPRSTSEILHPELYLGDEPFVPAEFPEMELERVIGGLNPIWDDVAGELRIALLLNQSNFLQRMADLGQPDILDMPELVSKGIEHFSEREGSKAAAGWAGDRFFVYSTPGSGESVYWRSQWATEADADEFVAAITKSLTFRHKAKPSGEGWLEGSDRAMRVSRVPGNGVVVVDATDRKLGGGLMKQFQLAGEDQ